MPRRTQSPTVGRNFKYHFMNRGFFSILFVVFLLSFNTIQKGVSIVFRNDTQQDFKILEVNIRGEKFTFKNIAKGKITKSIIVPKSYRYCFAKAITSKDTLYCQPYDFVGEKLYTQGKLLMKLSDQPGGIYMDMQCEDLK